MSLSILIENTPPHCAQFSLRPWLWQSLWALSYLWVVSNVVGWMALWKASSASRLELWNLKAHYNNNDCFDVSNCLQCSGHWRDLSEAASTGRAAGTRSYWPPGFRRSHLLGIMQVQHDVALGGLIRSHRVLSTAHTVKACSQIPKTSYTTEHHHSDCYYLYNSL